MTALHRVKAYFGMVPADELDSYDGYGDYADADRYDDDRHDGDRFARRPRQDRYGAEGHEAYAGARYDDARHGSDRTDRYGSDRYGTDRYGAGRYGADRYGSDRYDDHYDDRFESARHERPAAERFDADRPGADRPERPARGEAAHGEERVRTPKPRDPEPEVRADASRPGTDQDRTASGDRDEEADVTVRSSTRGRSWEHNTGPNHTSRSGRSGSLASVGTGSSGSASSLSASLSASGAAALALDEPVRRPAEREVAAVPDAPALPEITTLQPTSYNEARIIGERYRDGIPVIMNLTEMDDVGAKRLVDFAAGLAFALRGSIEKVTNRVFLLSPPNVEVSATDRRKLAEKSFSTAP
jgi:cell division inhibitor SepF